MNAKETMETSIEPHVPHWISRGAFQVLIILFFLTQASLGLAVYRANYWLAVPLVLISSHLMHSMLIGFHEASHGLLRKSRLLNEFDGLLIGTLSLMSFSLYRAAHQLHHAYLASERDEELWPFVHPRMPRGVRVLAAVLELTMGLLFTPFLFIRTFLRRDSPIRKKELRRRIWVEFALTGADLDCHLDGSRGLQCVEILPLAASHSGVAGCEHAKLSQVCGARRTDRLNGEQLHAQHRE
jgi:fatty acid desaturase